MMMMSIEGDICQTKKWWRGLWNTWWLSSTSSLDPACEFRKFCCF